jgi:Domain of unknown function (DUF2383)
MTMSKQVVDALHDVHTATNDVLTGYREMSARAQPDIQPVIDRLTEMHTLHAGEQAAALAQLREAVTDDTSLQGTVNKVVVIMRDWLSRLDRDTLPAVREGEESLRNEYNKALQLAPISGHAVGLMLTAQLDAINGEIARLPLK